MIRYLSLFSGIGAFESAFRNLEIPFELINYCEIDKYAAKSYSLIQDVSESKNLGDITKIDESKLDEVDFITYGFPCQDISLAGHQKGLFNDDGSKTRSGLFFDALRIITHTHPKVAIAENVKNLTSNKFSEQFKIVLDSLEEAGYNNYWKVLNAADYGMPQKRERVFIVSIRKDADTGCFQFPEPYELKKCLGDFLSDDVDKSYYLSEEMVSKIEHSQFNQKKTIIQDRGGICQTLLARDCKDPKCVIMENRIIQSGVRKLTPLEYLRLMGFKESDYEVLKQNGLSKTQIYKMAGNSIVVDVAEELLCMLFDSNVCCNV